MAVKSTFRSSNYTSESFQSTTFQFSLEKVCLALQKFHKAQTTNMPPTHRRHISYVIKLNSCERVGRQSADCQPTRRPTCWPTRRWDRILNFYLILYQWTNNNGEIEMTILTIVHVSHLHCYFIPTEEQQRLD